MRLRPPNEAEESERYSTVTHAISDHMLVFDPKVQAVPGVLQAKPRGLNNRRFKDLKYAFDHVFGPGATNREVFEHATKGIVSGVLNGYNCSGKFRFSMFLPESRTVFLIIMGLNIPLFSGYPLSPFPPLWLKEDFITLI